MPVSEEVTDLPLPVANWPWREGNRFTLLDATEQYFERMIQAIDDAQSYILLEMYLVESGVLAGRFVEAIRDVGDVVHTGAVRAGEFTWRRCATITRRTYFELPF